MATDSNGFTPPGEEVTGPHEEKPIWLLRLLWSITWAEIALRDYEWLFSDHRATQNLRRLVEESEQAAWREDEAKGRLEKEIDEVLEKEFKGLMILLYAEMYCAFWTPVFRPSSLMLILFAEMHLGEIHRGRRMVEPGMLSQIRTLIKETCEAVKARNVSEANAKVSQLEQKLAEARQQIIEADSSGGEIRDIGTLLKPEPVSDRWPTASA